MDKKLVVATDGVYLILFFKSFIRIYLPILQAAECNHAATNSVILYINRIHLYIHTHIVIFDPYKILQYINQPIVVSFPERNGALHCAAIYHTRAIYNPTNNGVQIKFRNKNHLPNFSQPPPLFARIF